MINFNIKNNTTKQNINKGKQINKIPNDKPKRINDIIFTKPPN